jgi:hypothetical protein
MQFKPNAVYHAFHKGDRGGFAERVVSGIIKLSTLDDFRQGKALGFNTNQYSHTEMIFPKSIAGEANSFSSRGMDKPSGVQFKNIDYTKHPDRWDFVELLWLSSTRDIIVAHEYAKSLVGKAYAYNNVLNTFSFVRTYKDRKGNDDFWCSECDALAAGHTESKVSPNKLYTLDALKNRQWVARAYEQSR